MSLSVSELFVSLQGESTWSGLPCAFVRLAGCNLDCRYCDTRYARSGGREVDLDEILRWVASTGLDLVEVTGGEPLLQRETPLLCERLVSTGHTVLVETNGSLDISVLREPVVRILDVKCPGSGMHGFNRWENLELLRPGDEVKFVISDRRDFDWAVGVVDRWSLVGRVSVLFSAAEPLLPARKLAEWILESGRPLRLQIQLHKVLWPERERGV